MTKQFKLILQGSDPRREVVDQLAHITSAAAITQIADHAFRLDEVSIQNKDAVITLANNSALDANFVDASLKLSDFGLLAMDMDSTLITIECIDEIADMQGLKSEVSEITEAAMRGELDFCESLSRRVALLKGLPYEALSLVYEHRLRYSPGAHAMLAACKAAGLKTLLVSGGFTYFTSRVQAELGLDHAHSNQLEVLDGRLTGRVLGEIVDARVKRRTVEATCASIGIPSSKAIVVGDGANDIEMMSVAGLSIAFRAKPLVRQTANVAFNFVGLDGLIHLFL